MISLTATVLTFNEAKNIGSCLERLRWVSRVVVVDSFSTEGTSDIVRSFANAELVQREFDTHANQWNFGLRQVQTPWVLALDADYMLSEQLVDEISGLQPDEDTAGYIASFNYIVFGRALRYSVYPPHTILFRRDAGSYYDEGHTQKLAITGKQMTLRHSIDHDDRKPLSRWIRSQDRYAILEARHLIERSPIGLPFRDRMRRQIYFAPIAMLFYLLIWRGLIFDGWRGWYYVAQRVIAELLLSLRLIEQKLPGKLAD
jgi:glycosyltransferase involved in cell wall biosynthesis